MRHAWDRVNSVYSLCLNCGAEIRWGNDQNEGFFVPGCPGPSSVTLKVVEEERS